MTMALISCVSHGSWNCCAPPEGKVKYTLRRGIEEGCPLSPALLLLLYEAVHETLRREFPEAAFYVYEDDVAIMKKKTRRNSAKYWNVSSSYLTSRG